MSTQMPTIGELFKVGAHFGHRKNRTDARSHKYIFTYRNKVAVIDLEKTLELLDSALKFVKDEAEKGSLFLFVGTKQQSRDLVEKYAKETNCPYIIERWPGGLVTNYDIVSKTIKRMIKTEADLAENKYEDLKKKEVLKITKDLEKTQSIFGGLKNMEKKPSVLIVVDARKEENAIKEAKCAGIKVVALCDTNSNPQTVDFPIVCNDDSSLTVDLMLKLISQTIKGNFKQKAAEGQDVEERIEKVVSEKPKPEKKAEKTDKVEKVEKPVKKAADKKPESKKAVPVKKNVKK